MTVERLDLCWSLWLHLITKVQAPAGAEMTFFLSGFPPTREQAWIPVSTGMTGEEPNISVPAFADTGSTGMTGEDTLFPLPASAGTSCVDTSITDTGFAGIGSAEMT